MPTYRSITISLISQFDLFTIPEFPPPETPKDPFFSVPALVNPVDAVVSVFIPTYPSSQFWISYSISPPYPPNALYYFKLFLNGACVVSWGCGKKDGYKGKTMFALCDSGEMRNGLPALERRVLCFKSEIGISKTGHGDVMEMRVYRSRGRKRIPPVVEPFHELYHGNDKNRAGQSDEPGINLANAGIAEHGHPRKFYKYVLIDPLDHPFATFRYLYCDWNRLQAIGVISPAPSTDSSIHSHEISNSLASDSLPTTSCSDLASNSDSNSLTIEPSTLISDIISVVSLSPTADAVESPAPSPPKTPRKLSRTSSSTQPRPLASAMKGRKIPRSSSVPTSNSIASFIRRSPSPVKAISSYRLFSQSPARSSRGASLGVLKNIVNSAIKRRARAAGECNETIETSIEPMTGIDCHGCTELNKFETLPGKNDGNSSGKGDSFGINEEGRGRSRRVRES